MYVTGECKKCKGKVVFDIEEMNKQEVEEIFDKTDFGHCYVGYHVEAGKMKDYYNMDWSNIFSTSTEAKKYNNSKDKEEI